LVSAAALRCESPKPLLNGRYELSPFNTFGAKLRYTCDDGFTLIGLAERVCQGDGYWSGEAPVCHETDSPAAIDYQYESTICTIISHFIITRRNQHSQDIHDPSRLCFFVPVTLTFVLLITK